MHFTAKLDPVAVSGLTPMPGPVHTARHLLNQGFVNPGK
jgi:hypothetical protein